jgi:hypothetical protein
VLRQFAVAGFHRRAESIRNAQWSYYRWLDAKHERKDPELYRLSRDPGETKNVIAGHPDVAARLDRKLTNTLTDATAPSPRR